MHAFTVAAALVSIVSLSAAAPTIEKRQDVDIEAGQVTICTGANNSGDCYTKTYKSNECNILPAPYYQNVLTFAPGHQILCRVTKYESPTLSGLIFHALTMLLNQVAKFLHHSRRSLHPVSRLHPVRQLQRHRLQHYDVVPLPEVHKLPLGISFFDFASSFLFA
ncbi:hypothetical protein BKA80DRAFT_270102 [Phyllosticta citrichinensis]